MNSYPEDYAFIYVYFANKKTHLNWTTKIKEITWYIIKVKVNFIVNTAISIDYELFSLFYCSVVGCETYTQYIPLGALSVYL